MGAEEWMRILEGTGPDMNAVDDDDDGNGGGRSVVFTSLALNSQLRRALPRPDAPCLRGIRKGGMKSRI